MCDAVEAAVSRGHLPLKRPRLVDLTEALATHRVDAEEEHNDAHRGCTPCGLHLPGTSLSPLA
eukprot:2809821-Rhodomonas_salina.1